MDDFHWDPEKSAALKRSRGISFEEVLTGRRVGVIIHPARLNQRLLLLEVDGYIWVVPFVESEGRWFLKAIYASRKYTKLWKKGNLSSSPSA